jgi:zinc/manganese transport system substrate-binding protein
MTHLALTLPTCPRRTLLRAAIALPWVTNSWSTTAQAGLMHVVTSFSVLADWVAVIGGPRVVVQTLVGADADAHTFEPRPADAKTLLGAQLLVTNGLQFDPWAHKLAQSAGFAGTTLVASDGITPRKPKAEGHDSSHHHTHTWDPHAWQSPLAAQTYVRNIAQALTRIDPAGAPIYQANLAQYLALLQDLDTWAEHEVGALSPHQRRVITTHDALGYLGARYQIEFLTLKGLSTDSEPSARQVGELIHQIKRQGVKAMFLENMSDPKWLTQLSRDTGVVVGPALYTDALSAPGQAGDTYLNMMRHNITALVAGMRQNASQ